MRVAADWPDSRPVKSQGWGCRSNHLYADQSESIRSEAVFGQEFTQKINDGNLIRPDGTLSSPFGLKLWRTPVVDSLHHLRGHGEVEMGG